MTNLDIIKKTKRSNIIDLQLSSNDIYEFNIESSNTEERIDTLNYVNDNHFLLSLLQIRFVNNLTKIRSRVRYYTVF